MMKIFSNLSIKYKLISTISLVAVFMGLFVFLFFPYQQRKQILNQAKENTLSISKMTADNLVASLEFEDDVTANEVLNILEENEEFVFVLVKDINDKNFAAINLDKVIRPGIVENVKTYTCKIVDNMTIAKLPIQSREIRVGTLILGLSIEKIKAEINRSIMIAMTVISFLVLFAIISSILVGDVIAKPIQKVIEISSKIAQGDFSSNLEVNSKDEVGKLSNAFNEMSKKLKTSIGELEISEERYHNLIEFANAGFITTEKGKITQINMKAEEIYGYSKDELLGKSPNILTLEKYKSQHREMVDELFKSGKAVKTSFEEEGVRKDSSLFHVEIAFSLSKSKDKDGFAIIAVMRDITERKKSEKEVKEARDFLENIIRTSADGIMIGDPKGCIIKANKAFEKIVGYTQEELIGISSSSLSSREEEHVKIASDMIAQLFESGSVENVETFWMRKDGSLFPAEVSMAIMKDKGGNITGGVSIIRDITDRKEVEKELRETKDFLEKLIENTVDGIMICDLVGNIINVNSALERMSGLEKEELIGEHASILIKEDEELRKMFREKAVELFEKGSTSYETVLKRKDGKYVEADVNTSMIKDEKGDYIAAVSLFRDITERKEIEEKLLQSEKLKSLGELAGGVAHDFNNVLAAILGRVQLLRMSIDAQTKKQERRKSVYNMKKGLEIIEKASLDCAETVRRIQEFSRRRTDDKYFKQVDVNELINNALEFTKVKWKDDAESKGLKYKIKNELSPLPLTAGSASEIREVLTNLINNAIDAMPQGGEIRIMTFKDNGHISIKIGDNGIGISKKMQDRIFDPFFTTKGVQSTGLGLSVSYGIINRHRGTIRVESVEGRGTTFTIQLPLSEKTAIKEKVKPMTREQKKASILVVEDEEDVQELLKDILSDFGHEVETVSRGSQGVEVFKRKTFDLVFTDLGMPGMSGWQVAEEVKKINKEIPVALITGWEIQLKDSELKKSGVDLVLAKPFKVKQVLELVQEGLALKYEVKDAS